MLFYFYYYGGLIQWWKRHVQVLRTKIVPKTLRRRYYDASGKPQRIVPKTLRRRYYDASGKPQRIKQPNSTAKDASNSANTVPDPQSATQAVENLQSRLQDADLSKDDMKLFQNILKSAGGGNDDPFGDLSPDDLQAFQKLVSGSAAAPPPPPPRQMGSSSVHSVNSSNETAADFQKSKPAPVRPDSADHTATFPEFQYALSSEGQRVKIVVNNVERPADVDVSATEAMLLLSGAGHKSAIPVLKQLNIRTGKLDVDGVSAKASTKKKTLTITMPMIGG